MAAPARVVGAGSRRRPPGDVRRVRPSGRTCAPSCYICASLRRSRSSGWRGCSLICSGLRSAKARSPTSCTTAHPRSRPRQARSSIVCCPAPCFNPTRPRPAWASGPSGPGSSIMPIVPASSRRRAAARRWSRRSWATVAPTSGFPTGLPPRWGWARVEHQVCLAHLIRDVQYAIDAGDVAFAPGVMGLLKQAVGIGRRRQTLADSTLVLYESRLQKRLDTLLAITPMTAAGQKLQRIFKRFRQNLCVFVTNRAVPPTNNGSEQALRPCVVFRKVTNCFRSEWGAALYADVRSVLETARRRGIATLDAVRLTLAGAPLPLAVA